MESDRNTRIFRCCRVMGAIAGLCALVVTTSLHADNTPTTSTRVADVPMQSDLRLGAAKSSIERNIVWTNETGLTQDALLLIDQLVQVDLEGIDTSRYQIAALTHLVDLPWRENFRAPLNRLLSQAFEQVVTDLGQGVVSPRKAQRAWFQDPPKVNIDTAYLALNVPGNTVKSVINQYRQPSQDYQRLKEAYDRYRNYAENGGWPFIAPGPNLRPGETDSRVFKLAQRLRITGDLPRRVSIEKATLDGTYTSTLARAVKRFQQRHGLQADGIVGKKSLQSLNIPAAAKVEKIRLNLERMRWLPHDLGERHVITNIADYRLKVIDGNEQVLTMPIIVGKEKYKTPVFSDEIEFLVINPHWTVPKSITYRELLPSERKNRGWLKKRNFELLSEQNGALVVKDPNTLTDEELAQNRFPYTIRQKPGPRNALGKVKFIFPNKYSIYLHDTPARSLFRQNERAFSHGCVRVGSPQALAETLLAKQGWTPNAIDKIYRKDKRKTIRLESPVPNHIVYLTSWEDERLGVQFREDVYGHDADLAAAIDNPEEIIWPAAILAALE